MALLPVRRESRGDIANLHRGIDEMINSFFGDWPGLELERRVWPAIDVSEDDNQITVKAEVPGCIAEDIDISVNGNMLTISGEKKKEDEKKDKGYYHIERSYGSFSRQISLPSDVETEKIDAACRNGILTITMPKQEKAKAKKIQIKGE